MSIVSRAIKAGLNATRRLHGEPITYTRGGVILSISLAVRGVTNWSTDAPFPGFRVGERSVDWLIRAVDLVDGETSLEPQRGDEIETESGEVFRVIPMAKDAPLWQWSDREGQSIRRIFTKARN